MSLLTGLLFLLLFTARWFKHYSINLVGERRASVGTPGELMLCDFADSRFGDRLLHVSSNLWCLRTYFGVLPAKNPLAWSSVITTPLVLLRAVILLIELRLACLRIIDLDVEERRSAVAA